MNDNLLDDGLKAVMGAERCQDMTKGEKPKKVTPKKSEAVDASWAPVEGKPNMLVECAKPMILFGGLVWLFFYWQQNQLMDYDTATYCMMALCLAAGLSIGKRAVTQ